jgi:glycosyltransferase involved in cell wall biosynthesis
MTLLMVHENAVVVADGKLRVDRKFHAGMLRYVERIKRPIVTVNPSLRAGQAIMDPIEVPLADLAYRPIAIVTDGYFNPLEPELIRQQIASSALVYGAALGSAETARSLGVPYVVISEHDLPTGIQVTIDGTKGIRRLVRSARYAYHYFTRVARRLKHAQSVHCNGYPAYDAAVRYNANRLLFFDSRMSSDMLISRQILAERCAKRRRLRLLFSGRYEPLKGPQDALRAAAECIRRGVDLEMHTYGSGTLKKSMMAIAAPSGGRIQVHDTIPYPELVERSRSFDLFICCHTQSDPSCTYLEAMGAGLPIAGYANKMWARLCSEAGAGLSVPIGRVGELAGAIERLAESPAQLNLLSEKALDFAVAHTFESEFDKRIGAINSLLL